MKITHLNRVFDSKHYDTEITKEEIAQIRQEFFNLTEIPKVHKQMKRLYYDNGREDSYIYDYYFYKLAANCVLKGQKWSINEFLQNDDLMRYAVAKVKSSAKVYPPSHGWIKNIRTVFRISPSGSAAKLSNFHYTIIKELIEEYKEKLNLTTLNYLDYSCGWGTRLSASLAQNVNYYGIDPNTDVYNKLIEMSNEFKSVTECTSLVDIRNQGSEIFIPEWVNKINIAFSSPPYYNLEDYINSNYSEQSIIKFNTYEKWLEGYWRQTVKNIKLYLKEDAYFMVNIKNIKEYDLLDDFRKIIISEGFTHVENKEVGNINRSSLRDNDKHNEEEMLVFKKL